MIGDRDSEAIICKKKAKQLFAEIVTKAPSVSPVKEFFVTKGWYTGFRKRAELHSIVSSLIVRKDEAASADCDIAEEYPINIDMSWTRDQMCVLLDEYEAHPILYDTKHEYYHNKMSRTDALQQILNVIIKIRPNTTIDMIKSKLNTLRTQFNKEMNHLKTKLGSSEANGHHVSLWCFKRMIFLKDHVLTKKYNIPIMVPEEEQQLPIKKEHSQESWVDFSDNLENHYEQENIEHQEEELLSPTSSNESDPLKNNKKRKRSESNEDITDIPTIFTTKETEDKWDVFSKFITSEIRTIKSERRKKIIKRGIISLIFKHQEEEEEDGMN